MVYMYIIMILLQTPQRKPKKMAHVYDTTPIAFISYLPLKLAMLLINITDISCKEYILVLKYMYEMKVARAIIEENVDALNWHLESMSSLIPDWGLKYALEKGNFEIVKCIVKYANLKDIIVTYCQDFNQPIVPGTFKDGMIIIFGQHFNQPIALGTFKKNSSVTFGKDFNQPIVPGTFKKNSSVTFGKDFNQPIVPGTFKKNSSVTFGKDFNQPIVPGIFEEDMEVIFGHNFNQPIVPGTFEEGMEVTFGKNFNQYIEPGTFEEDMEVRFSYEFYNYYFNDCIKPGSFDVAMTIHLDFNFDQPIVPGIFEKDMTVKFGLHFNQPIVPGTFEKGMTVIFGEDFEQPIVPGTFEEGMTVSFSYMYDQFVLLPKDCQIRKYGIDMRVCRFPNGEQQIISKYRLMEWPIVRYLTTVSFASMSKKRITLPQRPIYLISEFLGISADQTSLYRKIAIEYQLMQCSIVKFLTKSSFASMSKRPITLPQRPIYTIAECLGINSDQTSQYRKIAIDEMNEN
jgi:hypothetical protein